MKTAILFLLASWTLGGQQPLRYHLTCDRESPFPVSVTLQVPADAPESLELAFPAWYLGVWNVPPAHRNTRRFAAKTADGRRLKVDERERGRWHIARPEGQAVVITYEVAAPFDRANARHFIRETGLLLEGARVFARVKGLESRVCEVTWSKLPANWTVASPLSRSGDELRAKDHHQLVDAPLLFGVLIQESFDHDGVIHDVVIERGGAAGPWDKDKLLTNLKALASAARAAYGPFPYEHYLLILVEDAPTESSGRFGSTVIACPVGVLGGHQVKVALSAARGLVRSWCPHGFGPIETADLLSTQPAPCPSLWLVDGLAEHYARLLLCRSGVVDHEAWLKVVTARILEHRNHPLAERVSPTEASLNAWETPTGVDPGLQGQHICLLLDALIRSGSDGKRSLDDLVRLGRERWSETGFKASDISALVKELAGRDHEEFFTSHVGAAKGLPWDDVLAQVGLRFEWIRCQVQDPGLKTTREGDRLLVLPLPARSPIAVAGLKPGDHVLRVNQRKVETPDDVDLQIARLRPGGKLRVDVRRGDKQRSYRITLSRAVALSIPVELVESSVAIARVDPGPLRDAGVEPGDVLEKIDNRRITTPLDIIPALSRVRDGKTLLTVRRKGKRLKIRVAAPDLITWRGSLREDPKATPKARRLLADLLSR